MLRMWFDFQSKAGGSFLVEDSPHQTLCCDGTGPVVSPAFFMQLYWALPLRFLPFPPQIYVKGHAEIVHRLTNIFFLYGRHPSTAASPMPPANMEATVTKLDIEKVDIPLIP